MSAEISREDFGMTPRGAVTLITFSDNVGESTTERYQIRHGVRTVGDYASKSNAETAARAIAKGV